MTGGRWIKMYYDGSGTLLKRQFSTGEYWEYMNGLVFKNGQLFSMAIPEGRALHANGNWAYEFFYTDHLGNQRVAFRANGSQLEKTSETHFDPWGLELAGIGQSSLYENRFKYQEKESLELFGLGNVVDSDARYLDKSIGRFWGIDAFADKNNTVSGYAYVMNNPIRFIDPFGLDTLDNTQANFNFNLVKSGDILKSGGTVLNETIVTAKSWSREQKLMDRFKTDFLSKNEYDNRDYGPYIPPAIGVEASFGADIVVANANMKAGVAVDDNNIIGYIGGGGGLGFSGLRMPSISFGISTYAMDRHGANSNQFNLNQGLLGVNNDIQIGHGLMIGNSQSMIRNPKGSGYLRDPYGYSSYSLGMGTGVSNSISLTKPIFNIRRK